MNDIHRQLLREKYCKKCEFFCNMKIGVFSSLPSSPTSTEMCSNPRCHRKKDKFYITRRSREWEGQKPLDRIQKCYKWSGKKATVRKKEVEEKLCEVEKGINNYKQLKSNLKEKEKEVTKLQNQVYKEKNKLHRNELSLRYKVEDYFNIFERPLDFSPDYSFDYEIYERIKRRIKGVRKLLERR